MAIELLNIKIKTWKLDHNHNYIKKNVSKYKLDMSRIITIPIRLFEDYTNWMNSSMKVGNKELEVVCLPNLTLDVIEITEELVEDFNLSEDQTYTGIINKNCLLMGPVIGVFYNQLRINNLNNYETSFRTWELIEANKTAHTILYFFGPEDVDFNNETIKGTYFDFNNNKWDRRYFPIPDIFYDREGTTDINPSLACNQVRYMIDANPSIRKINQCHYFDKWDVYKNLMKEPSLQNYLPRTVLYSRNNLKEFLDSFSCIYMKSCLGSNGREVVKIKRKSDGMLQYSYYKNGTKNYIINSVEVLLDEVETLFNTDKVIIQEGIEVINVNQCNIDIRATVQRNFKGVITIISYPVRRGVRHSPVTSTSTNSTVFNFEFFFRKKMNYSFDKIQELQNKIENFLMKVYESIEKYYGIFGEIGIDFALDKNGKLWFIECNAKPGKDTLYFGCTSNLIEDAFLNPLEYGKYLWLSQHENNT